MAVIGPVKDLGYNPVVLHVCQAGFESFLAKELNAPSLGKGPGWVRCAASAPAQLCFAHYSLNAPVEMKAASGRLLAQALTDFFLKTSRDEKYEAPWPLVIEGSGEQGADKRAHAVAEFFTELAKQRMARVVKLAAPGRPGVGPSRGLFAYVTGLGTLWASRVAIFGGQRRMADDPQAPSRSYLKVEEAYAVLGASPQAGESVLDLGAAPGGWSYSAAKRGASVLAIDNGPLKGGALNHPLITHRAEDAFKLAPSKVDWLFCDMVEDPDRVLELVGRWITPGLCRKFIVNLKYGRIDPLPLMRRARALESACSLLRLRHLFHDREELTLGGQVSDS